MLYKYYGLVYRYRLTVEGAVCWAGAAYARRAHQAGRGSQQRQEAQLGRCRHAALQQKKRQEREASLRLPHALWLHKVSTVPSRLSASYFTALQRTKQVVLSSGKEGISATTATPAPRSN